MCGIVGYIGKKQALPFLIEGLKKLEYRGYDSAGVCVSNGVGFFVAKRKGKVKELEMAIKNSEIIGDVGISHTRWATHGQPNETNAHPHLNCEKQIAVVHNGIVENFTALKKMVEKEGHKIISETDSEIIAHLIEKFYLPLHYSAKGGTGSRGDGNLAKTVAKTLKLIKGAYAFNYG